MPKMLIIEGCYRCPYCKPVVIGWKCNLPNNPHRGMAALFDTNPEWCPLQDAPTEQAEPIKKIYHWDTETTGNEQYQNPHLKCIDCGTEYMGVECPRCREADPCAYCDDYVSGCTLTCERFIPDRTTDEGGV